MVVYVGKSHLLLDSAMSPSQILKSPAFRIYRDTKTGQYFAQAREGTKPFRINADEINIYSR